MALSSSRLEAQPPGGVLYISFNAEHSCFGVGRQDGLSIYNCSPFREQPRPAAPRGGIGIVEMLHRSNMLALVGGGDSPQLPVDRVVIWADNESRRLHTITPGSQHEPVRGVKMRRDVIVIATDTFVSMYGCDFSSDPGGGERPRAEWPLLHKFRTCENRLGLFALAPASPEWVLACPGRHAGAGKQPELLRVERPADSARPISAPGLPCAEERAASVCALSADGRLCAVASADGTQIDIFDTEEQRLVHRLNRGQWPAAIMSMSFSDDGVMLCASSTRGTLHLFLVGAPEAALHVNNARSMLSVLSGWSGWHGAEWSFAKHRLGGPAVCAFAPSDDAGQGTKRTLFALSPDGTFRELQLDLEVPQITQRRQFWFAAESAKP
eukprot:TRINITY_DN7294_c0_g1_i2.p1 TRINITY_DN7294_c0_g1~~TRINITY_DN7294_c0_g1_i2.p1  ORF type:complete len:406 (+),score=143.17 TRINITY_DN7294_c0_g1_i2:74-1219(+)